ncbi:uncharacterized protein [Macrobrachium rosenbergii]|uniref:uncharacterized protein n=1 Tax=Macrobrachium rosenbergii TaxID=79674 RepID=UPI0034D3AB5D
MNRRDRNLVLRRGGITTLRDNGLSIRAIARDAGVSLTSVQMWIRWEESGNLNDLPRPEGPRKTTPAENDAIVRAAREQPLTNAEVIREDLGLEVSSMTGRRRLHAAGIHHTTSATKELLTERHKAGRLDFVQRHADRAMDFWGRVIFTDEKCFSSTSHGKLHWPILFMHDQVSHSHCSELLISSVVCRTG